jgi:hypothetical protein
MKSATTNKQTNIPKGFGQYPTFGQDHGDVEISYLWTTTTVVVDLDFGWQQIIDIIHNDEI